MHMRRALGTLTPWATYEKATEIKLNGFDDGVLREDSEEAATPSTSGVDTAVLSDG